MAGGGLQALKRRIRSVENTRQITRAMKLVAGAKLRRAQERAEQARSYFVTIREVMGRASRTGSPTMHPLFIAREVRVAAYVVVTSDRGLAGPFNSNVLRHAALLMRRDSVRAGAFAVGRKARDAYRRRGVPILGEFTGLGDNPHYYQAKAIADAIIAMYQRGEVDRVDLVYTQFINAMAQRPVSVQILPMAPPEQEQVGSSEWYAFEPDAETVLKDLVPRYIEVLVYGALLESKASEHGARMTAMDSATKNSEELLRRMTLTRNRLRQAAITREIAELVGGAAALE